MTGKNILRIKAKEIRKNLPMDVISSNLVKLIRRNEFYLCANNVMLFYPTKYEVDLRDLFNDNKDFFLPRVKGEELEVCPYKTSCGKFSELKKSTFGIFEPVSEPVDPKILNLVIVPALMADKNGYRLGYGGGFYDRFINKYGKNFKTICPIAKELVIDFLPADKYDKKIDCTLTC